MFDAGCVNRVNAHVPRVYAALADVPSLEVQFPTILRAFDCVRTAAASDGRRRAGSPREITLADDPVRCQVAQRYITAS